MSPQSLAKTRDKRSHRIPARFDDFIPPEVVNHRNVVELRSKPKKVVQAEPEPDLTSHSLRISPPKSEPPAKRASTSSSRNSTRNRSKSRTRDRRATLPSQQQPPKTIPPPDTQVDQNQESSVITNQHGSTDAVDNEFIQHSNELAIKNGDETIVIDLECKETPLESKPTSRVKETDKPTLTPKVKEQEPIVVDSVENKEKTILSKKVDAPEIIKKGSPFHPSITISNSYKINQQLTPKPLSFKKTGSPASSPLSVTQKSSSPRKKSKSSNSTGSSLLKPNNNNAFQTNTLINRLPIQQLPQQQTKYFNNLTPNMQYGTRLMLNEQVYLPRSVGNIAPITTTLQQIANQARKPPFISKKAEAYIAYQEGRKFNYMTSIYTASVKITKYLDVEDLLNLRLVNKTWKSIIDSDAVWKKVTLSVKEVTSWTQFVQTILCRYQTADLVLEDWTQMVDFELNEIFKLICAPEVKLERVWLQSVEPYENLCAIELLSSLSRYDLDKEYFDKVQIIWRVKIGIDDYGLATVPFERHKIEDGDAINDNEQPSPLQLFPELIERDVDNGDDDERLVMIELNQLEDHFNAGKKVMRTKNNLQPSPLVLVEPI